MENPQGIPCVFLLRKQKNGDIIGSGAFRLCRFSMMGIGVSVKCESILRGGSNMASLKRLLIGRPLKSTELGEQKLNKTKALAILSSDALSSVAYGPEQILIVLMTVGAAAFWYSLPIGVGVLICWHSCCHTVKLYLLIRTAAELMSYPRKIWACTRACWPAVRYWWIIF